jgi:hypothetical protein
VVGLLIIRGSDDDDGEGEFTQIEGPSLLETLTGPGKVFVSELKAGLGGAPVELFAPYAGQAAQLLLSAIAPSPARADVVAEVFQAEVDKGIIGTFSIIPSGDPSQAPIGVSVAGDTFELAEEITAPPEVVAAARGG